ncbi:PIN domain-containing protein [Cupriavidus sp. TMH.W2]|uniref:PIN domain-containing protein n=1 Tax=Cupriavidus sp. TMH.W2 TaxID=3434465 RepID=UPI003D78AE19
MAGFARCTALLDACVLYPIAITDALLSLATAGLFAARWTLRIEGEWIAALEAQRPELSGRLGVRRDAMREAVADWEVAEATWMPLVQSFCLPDPDDRHVLAAAIAGHADYIVTRNRRDFPCEIVKAYGIEVIDPDGFIVRQWDLAPVTVGAAFRQMRARRKQPFNTAEEFAQALARNGLPATAQRVREAAHLI